MLKRVFGRKLSRSRPAREALFASLARSMILSGKVVTTHAKAKAIQSSLEKMVTLAKKGNLIGIRKILASLDNARDAVEVMVQKIVPSFSNRTSGYTRLVSLPRRRGDNAEVVRIEWTPSAKKATARQGKNAKNISAKRKRN